MDFGSVVVQDRKTGETKARYEYLPMESLEEIEEMYRGAVFIFIDHRLLAIPNEVI
jgi:hypothetical protein